MLQCILAGSSYRCVQGTGDLLREVSDVSFVTHRPRSQPGIAPLQPSYSDTCGIQFSTSASMPVLLIGAARYFFSLFCTLTVVGLNALILNCIMM